MKKVEVCAVEEIKSLTKKEIVIDGQEILLIYFDGDCFAVENRCPHAKTHLISGRVEEGAITCSNHGACFDLKTGDVRIDKIDEDLLEQIDIDDLPFGPLKTYPVSIVDNMVLVDIV